jgi:hypothetical protein
MKFRLTILTCLMATFIGFAAHAQVDTIRLKDKQLLTSFLKPGLNQYLVYYQIFKTPKKLHLSFWSRDIQIKERNGEKVFTIDQHWYGDDTSAYWKIYSINKAADFAPIFHSETGLDTTNAYNWDADKITGADTIPNNPQKSFLLEFSEPNFNWNLDIETFEMLPLAANKTFAINFYDAGLEPPRYVIYKVIGSEVIATFADQRVDCWELRTEGDSKGRHFSETYWISKKTHEFLKEEDAHGSAYRYKIKMQASSPDLILRDSEHRKVH